MDSPLWDFSARRLFIALLSMKMNQNGLRNNLMRYDSKTCLGKRPSLSLKKYPINSAMSFNVSMTIVQVMPLHAQIGKWGRHGDAGRTSTAQNGKENFVNGLRWKCLTNMIRISSWELFTDIPIPGLLSDFSIHLNTQTHYRFLMDLPRSLMRDMSDSPMVDSTTERASRFGSVGFIGPSSWLSALACLYEANASGISLTRHNSNFTSTGSLVQLSHTAQHDMMGKFTGKQRSS